MPGHAVRFGLGLVLQFVVVRTVRVKAVTRYLSFA
jgi:hypothetical protein